MSHLPGKFVWFEHVSGDVARGRAFYGDLFGWRSDGMPIGGETYHMILNGTEGIGGFRTAPAGVPTHWHSYLSVADVDATVAAAVAAGAKVHLPPTDFAPVGRGAAIADPTGAVFSVWKGAQPDRPDVQSVAIGDWYWHECLSPDPDRALAFYVKVFGYVGQTMNMPEGPYHVLSKDAVPRCGLMQSPQPGAPAGWMPYVSVADCDASLAKAVGLGAQVCLPAMDVPEVGRFAVIMDPLGAVLGLVHAKPMA
jgi:predicted enzyme related to lactoylglutathione lyase